MAGDKETRPSAEQQNDHEAVLTGVMALANLFNNCVEAFGLIHPGQKWLKEEQLLLCAVGVQQARLLVWGDVVGVSSPPASVTDRAIPRHPSAAYPDLKEPTFFGARDPRLDETDTRKDIDAALSAIMDRWSGNKDEMMNNYGMKPPKRFAHEYHNALDTNRLEAHRERYELLKEVAETYARISMKRPSTAGKNTWTIADQTKFHSFLKLTQAKVDFLINMMDVKERVDRGMRMDIRALGWHLSADRTRIAMDVSKLRMIAECCKDDYPEYLESTTQALSNIERERRENVMDYNPYASLHAAPVNEHESTSPNIRRGSTPFVQAPKLNASATNGNADGAADKPKRPSLFGKLFGSSRRSSQEIEPRARNASIAAGAEYGDPPRSLSDTGQAPRSGGDDHVMPEDPVRSKSVGATMETPDAELRSKSLGDVLDKPAQSEAEEILKKKLERLTTEAQEDEKPDDDFEPISSAISRHDQYHGLARQGTKQNWE